MPNSNARRLLVVGPRLDIGGTERHLLRVLPALRQQNLDVRMFVLERGGKLESEMLDAGVSVLGPPLTPPRPLHIARACWQLVREMRARPPDIVHFFLPEPYLIGSLAALYTQCDTRIMSRRSLNLYQDNHTFLACFERRLHRRTTVLLGNSTAVVTELVRECANAEKVGLIHNGIAIPQYPNQNRRAAVRHELRVPENALVIGIVANLIAYKGHLDLLDAIGRISDFLPNLWRLIVVGRDEGIGCDLRKKISALGLDDHVLMLAERNDAEQLFAAFDIAVLASHEEGFSNSLIEAMARGNAVVATAVGGNVDAIVNGESGLFVSAKNPEALGAAILRLATDFGLRARLGIAARRRAESLFALEVCVQRYLNLYESLRQSEGRVAQDMINRGPASRNLLRS